MRTKLHFWLLLIAAGLCGCTKQSTDAPNNTGTSKPTPLAPSTSPSEITLIKSPEVIEKKAICEQARRLLNSKSYDKLDELARKYRLSKESYPDGEWKLSCVYLGCEPDEESSDAQWKATLANLHEWIKTKPGSGTARVALANTLVNYAWKARGSGWADSVTEAGGKLMGERLIEAMKILKEADALQEKCPAQWSVLFSAALGLGVQKSQYESVFQQAVQFEPHYPKYYFAKAYYLLPRWYGKTNDTADFLQKSADKIGGEDGDLLYAQAAWNLQKSVGGNVFDESYLSPERVEKGFQVMEKRFPNSGYVQNAHAYMCLLGANNARAPRLLVDGLHGQIDSAIWASKENFLQMTKNLYR